MVLVASNYCLYYNMILWSMQLLFIYNARFLNELIKSEQVLKVSDKPLTLGSKATRGK